MNKIESLYDKLMKMYGPQGWWPINGTYHKKNYKITNSFEIIIGCILTQNTNWKNVEKALNNFDKITFEIFDEMSIDELKEKIKPAGYFNQKATYIKNIIKFLKANPKPSRQEILQVKGIGPETADSIMLYGFGEIEFVVDTYTKRIFSHHKIINGNETYHQIKELIEKSIPRDYIIYNEFHALLVEHAKKYYSKKPYSDPIDPITL